RNVIKESSGPGMPRFYRTPDLVEYLKVGRPLTTASDVFQLGLVLAELFTGTNPEKPMERNDYSADVELEPLADIDHHLWPSAKQAIQQMLKFDPVSRHRPGALIPIFVDLYLEEARNEEYRRR